MAVRDDFAAGEVLAAADLNDTFASKLPYSYGTATPSTSDSGFLWFDSNSTPAATKFWDGSAFVPFGGKILQIVRATDSTQRTTTSSAFVDANISVTITPQKSDSAIIVIASNLAECLSTTTGAKYVVQAITDSSNNVLSGAETNYLGMTMESGTKQLTSQMTTIGYSTPATTSATTYKLRFRISGASTTGTLYNDLNTGQMYAIEVSA